MTFEPADVYWINDDQDLELLADPTRLEIIELLMIPRSVKQVAEAMDVPRTRLYHHFGLLEEGGMITVVEERPAGALTEKIYQVSAKSYQPSERFAENADPRRQAEAMMSSLLGATRADFVRAIAEERFSLSDTGTANKVSLGRRLMVLTPERLHQFIQDLEQLFEQYGDHEKSEDAITVGVLHIVHPSSRRYE